MKGDYTLHFINSIINDFQKFKDHRDENFITSPDLFWISKPYVSIEIPYCEHNEIKPISIFWRNFTNLSMMI